MFHSLTPKKYHGTLHHSKGLEISYFLVYHMFRYDRFSRDMTVLVQLAQITCPPLSNLKVGHYDIFGFSIVSYEEIADIHSNVTGIIQHYHYI